MVPGGRDGGDVGLEFGEGVCGGHAGDEAEGDLGGGFAGDDGFCAGAGEAADDAVDVERGAGPEALEDGVAGFAGEGGAADFVGEVVGLVEGKAGPGGEFGGGGGLNAVVDAGNEDGAFGVFELRDDVGDGDEGVGRGSAVHAAVEVGACAVDFDFGVDHAAEADAEGGQAGGEHVGVGDEGDVGF